ncbi:MAG: bifunctional phosphopantothenoylcysteine decarboxylase/phosphopantothenate--cysteine ligase CoaBC [Crocinitomicaceae bacterium]|nr:bifunctional phosphopantothenoylcysteine decarboxylase/phosphopantothenate--cysteine ligase CoaBC [Crocinitomicaceae bacterium]
MESILKGKRIVLGITGGIAAYKIPYLVRLLKKSGAEVKCLMTASAAQFVTAETLATLSENDVPSGFWKNDSKVWNNHVELGLWADLLVIAPLSANTLAKLTYGVCDNLLLATYLSAKCPVILAPAMDLDMYAHPATKENLRKVVERGNIVLPANSGPLASGLDGQGRMQEPEEIFSHIQNFFTLSQSLQGNKIIITAGPTYEAIDPVRFIGNHSSGKMGFALAKAFLAKGAEVILITGPNNQNLSHPNLKRIAVNSALEMLDAVKVYWSSVNGGVFAAAVADYRPKVMASEKIKKSADEITIELVKNPDIIAWAGEHKKERQWLGGFALETENLIENAKLKLVKKNLDFIVANSLNDFGAGFGLDTNQVTILSKNNNSLKLELASKMDIAKNIVKFVEEKIK